MNGVTVLRSFIASPRSICIVAALVVAVRAKRGAPKSTRISPASSAKSRKCGTAASCSGAIRCLPATRFSASYFETDFASFLAWRDWGFPDRDVFNGFGMGALRCADGAFVLGEMGRHTVERRAHLFSVGNARPRRYQRTARSTSPAASSRELAEETGLTAADYRADPHWHCVYTGPAIAMIRILHVDMPGDALRAGSRPISPGRISPNCPPSTWCAASAISPRRCRALSPASSRRSFRGSRSTPAVTRSPVWRGASPPCTLAAWQPEISTTWARTPRNRWAIN